jgi:hypothetical protein
VAGTVSKPNARWLLHDATVSVVAALLGEELDWLTPAQIFAAAEVVVAGLVSEAGG